MKTGRLIVLFMLMLATVACGVDRPMRLTEADNGRTNTVNAGREIEIVLKGNPTTGYSWDMASFSTNKLQQIGAVEYRQDEQSDARVGVGGKFVFKFKTVKPGESNIKIVYRRSWETTAYDKVYSVVFDVK